MTETNHTLQMTADIVSAFVSRNPLPAGELPRLIGDTYAALASTAPAQAAPEPQQPAVPIKKSITPDHLICLEDGGRFRSLKRHLRVVYGLTPDEYRAKWGLPPDYPMVAPNYSARRSDLAKASGLGRIDRRAA